MIEEQMGGEEEEERGEEAGREEEQGNKARDIQDMDEQQRCIVSRRTNFNESFVPLK